MSFVCFFSCLRGAGFGMLNTLLAALALALLVFAFGAAAGFGFGFAFVSSSICGCLLPQALGVAGGSRCT